MHPIERKRLEIGIEAAVSHAKQQIKGLKGKNRKALCGRSLKSGSRGIQTPISRNGQTTTCGGEPRLASHPLFTESRLFLKTAVTL